MLLELALEVRTTQRSGGGWWRGYADELRPGGPTAHPTAAYAPAVILRKRGNRGMVTALRTIADTIRGTGELPGGIRNLIDPDHEPIPIARDSAGAIVEDGDDQFLPLPLNEVQLRILDHVDRHAHTLVQGPPGTGKTHTAAALITHLLAQGKRVLITAHTDRALHEVRNKLPEEIKDLCVAVVGDSRRELEDLKASVNRISHEAAEFDPAHNRRIIAAAERTVEELRRQRAGLQAELLRLREHDVVTHTVGGRSGTVAEIATGWRAGRFEHGWIADLVAPAPDEPSPVPGALIEEWRTLLLDETLDDPEVAAPDLVSASDVPDAESFARLCGAKLAAARHRASFARYDGDPAVARIPELPPADRNQIQGMLGDISDLARDLRRRSESWVPAALGDVHSGHALEWQTRAAVLGDLLQRADETIDALGYVDVRVSVDDSGPLVSLAENLLAHIDMHGPIKIQADGSPKIGIMSPRVVKDAGPLFEHVRVDGRIPTGAEQLTQLLNADRGNRILHQLDTAWPAELFGITSGTLRERRDRHRVAQELLLQILDYATRLEYGTTRLREAGLPVPDWGDVIAVRAALETFDAVTAEEARQRAAAPLDELAATLDVLGRDPRATANLHRLGQAVRERDDTAYEHARQRLGELNALRHAHARRVEITALMTAVPLLRDAIVERPADPEWASRLRTFEQAWVWAAVGGWLGVHNVGGVNELCRRLDAVEDRLREQATVLADRRAWERAVGRLTNRAQADLRQYAQLVKSLGKGTGQYAERKRADIQRALGNCRSAVPVWIMPIYRVVEQFAVTADMFDVVVVDEASQAGAEAVFLQYLAPSIVVIGDDKQVSPAAVGVDESELERLAGQYLHDDRYRDSWKNPKRSLFDDAVIRYPARLTLVEHRRCVPEIIGFSNKIAYEPEGVRLVPVRRYGSDRLPPIRTVHVADGYESSSKVNPVEADRIVDQIEQCLADPRYEGKTFGVISLLGTAQAKYIRQQLMIRIPPEELDGRQLHCGDAADFQGAERDVVFLSLVAAPGPDRRLSAQTADGVVQRYNVAVSRARDQLWLFHSVTADQLTNAEDLPFRLLDYCLGVERATVEDEASPSILDDRLVEPFESLFEQQIYNRIVDRVYRISPHHTETGYDIDMVVTGSGGQVAIQCDDDRWDGPDHYRSDLARQRDLERCGWPIHRIRAAEFIADPDRCLAELWELLEHNEIYTPAEEENRRLAQLLAGVEEPVPVQSDSPELLHRVALVLVDADQDVAGVGETRLSACAEFGADIARSTAPEPQSELLDGETGSGGAELDVAVARDAAGSGTHTPVEDAANERLDTPRADDSSPEPPQRGERSSGYRSEPVSTTAAVAVDPATTDAEPPVLVIAPITVRSATEHRTSASNGHGETAAHDHGYPGRNGHSEPEVAYAEGGDAHTAAAATARPATMRTRSIEAYSAFIGSLESLTTAGHSAIVADFVRIVAAEGPVTAARLRAAYVTAARTRERDNVRKKLDIALQAAVATGKLLVSDDLDAGDPALFTYRMPEQPATSWRDLGPRKIEQMPPRELAEIMAHHAETLGWDDRAALFRAVISAVGQTRLTENTIAMLALVLPLARQIGVAV
ncbi:AAA domain-containing protein [Nocardia crassostreae]|uniref:AAA domain-containing protein n=1 Tax=Nocardia crassostreae TaxID=53428 RepID=UPI0009FC420C|nr:AAA domain-containing protein [Nocardia crassostreae]